jgi:hypothetical protein
VEEPGPAAIDWTKPKQSENFVIRGVRRQNAPGYVSTKAGWEYGLECIEAKLQYKGREDSVPGNVLAYFYTRDGKLIEKFDKPPQRQDTTSNYIDPPKAFEKGKVVEVYFPITPFLKDSDWATALIVFGSGSDYAVATQPGTSLEPLAFDEKEHLFPGWKPAGATAGPDPGAVSNVTVEARRLRKETHSDWMIFDGDYQEGKPCMTAEVRVQGTFTPGEGNVLMHFFDEAGKLVETRRNPSTTEITSGTYVGRPQIANDGWYPVFFALDGSLKDKRYPTSVLVFRFGGKTAALVESSAGATIESLEFPEKKNLSSAP